MPIYKAPTKDFLSTTLDGAINDAVTTITLTSTSNLQAPGYAVINRQDGSGTDTPLAREIVSFTTISGNDIGGVTRGEDNSTAREHADGSLVEFSPTVGVWNSILDPVDNALTADGYGLHVSLASIDTAIISTASVTDMVITNSIMASGASIGGFITDPLTQNSAAFTSIASIARVEGSNVVFSSTASIATANISTFTRDVEKGTVNTESDGATITFDMDVSNIHKVTLGGNRTLAVSNVDVGQTFIIRLGQDATGSRTVTWFATTWWDNGTTPTLTTTGGKVDVFGFVCTSAGNYDGFILGQNLG